MKQINFLPLYGSLSFSGRHAMLCKREHLAILLIIIAGILLRFHGIGFRDFNLDEAYSFLFAKNYSFDVVLSPMSVLNSGDRHPTLHYVICWLWLRSACPLLQATGLSMEAAFRSFATLFSFFTLITAIYCGRHIAGVRGGLLTGALLAFNGMSVFLAQDARMYSMLELAGACLFASLLRCQSDTEGKWSNLLLLILSSWFLMLCHYTGIIFVFSAWSWLFIKYKFWRSQLVIGALILTGLYAYWFFGFLFQLHKEQAGATAGFKFSSGLVVPFTYFSFIVGETLVLTRLPDCRMVKIAITY